MVWKVLSEAGSGMGAVTPLDRVLHPVSDHPQKELWSARWPCCKGDHREALSPPPPCPMSGWEVSKSRRRKSKLETPGWDADPSPHGSMTPIPNTFIRGVGVSASGTQAKGKNAVHTVVARGWLRALSPCWLVVQSRNHSRDFQGKVLKKGNEVLAPSLERLR